MPFNRGLKERLYENFSERHDLVVRKIFGGLCFSLFQYMYCAIIDHKLMARVGPENHIECFTKPYKFYR